MAARPQAHGHATYSSPPCIIFPLRLSIRAAEHPRRQACDGSWTAGYTVDWLENPTLGWDVTGTAISTTSTTPPTHTPSWWREAPQGGRIGLRCDFR